MVKPRWASCCSTLPIFAFGAVGRVLGDWQSSASKGGKRVMATRRSANGTPGHTDAAAAEAHHRAGRWTAS